MNKEIKRGQVWFYKPSIERPGHIQKGPRPVVIVSDDVINAHSPVVLAVPCTTQIKKNYPTHVLFIMNKGVSVALAEQAGPVCADELVECTLTLPEFVMNQIDTAVSYAYGLKPMPAAPVSQAHCPRPVQHSKPIQETKKRTKWTSTLMRRFLSDFTSLRSVDEVAAKYGLSVSTANTYKSKFETLIKPQRER